MTFLRINSEEPRRKFEGDTFFLAASDLYHLPVLTSDALMVAVILSLSTLHLGRVVFRSSYFRIAGLSASDYRSVSWELGPLCEIWKHQGEVHVSCVSVFDLQNMLWPSLNRKGRAVSKETSWLLSAMSHPSGRCRKLFSVLGFWWGIQHTGLTSSWVPWINFPGCILVSPFGMVDFIMI